MSPNPLAYIHDALAYEYYQADDCGCIETWRPNSTFIRKIFSCGGGRLNPVLHSVVLATYANPEVERHQWL